MKKFTKKSLLSEVIMDQEAVDIINSNLHSITNHPRFNEAMNMSLEDVIIRN